MEITVFPNGSHLFFWHTEGRFRSLSGLEEDLAAASVFASHKVGLNYVSCSPFRVPIARLAAAQAAVKDLKK